MAFDSIILLPENLQAQYKDSFKTIYKIENEGKKNIFEDKRVGTKILKTDENIQYGYFQQVV